MTKTPAQRNAAYRTRKAERIARMEARVANLEEALAWAIAEIEGNARYSRECQFGNCVEKAKAALGDYTPPAAIQWLPALHIET